MHRRSLLSWLGASAAGALNLYPRVAAAQPQNGTRLVLLETFCGADVDQMPRVHAYLGGTLLPFVSRIHAGPRIYLDAIVAPHTPQVLSLAIFSGFEEMLDIHGRIAADPGVRQARADLESEHVLHQVQSQVLTATRESLRFPADFSRFAAGIFEIRSYQAPAWHDGPPARLSGVFGRAGLHPIVNGSTAAGEHLPQFTYLIPFESLTAREDAWSTLESDPEWIGIQRDSVDKHGSAVKVTGKSIYKLAPYSQWA